MKTFADAEEVLAASLPGYESREPQQILAAGVERLFAKPEHFARIPPEVENDPDAYSTWIRPGLTHFLGQAGTGCIYGDAEIAINRGGNGKTYPLREVVAKFNGQSLPGKSGGVAIRNYAWDRSIPTMVQREAEDGTIRLGRLVAAWESGVKQTYTVTTDTGRTIRATDEHPFLTERGWLRLDQLMVGDEVHVRGRQASGRQRKTKPYYAMRSGLVGHPHATRREAKRHAFRHPYHRLVAEARLNHMETEVYLAHLRTGDVDGLQFLDPAVWAVHHIDHDHRNNHPDNLKVLTHKEHHRLHAHEGKTGSVLYKVATEKVMSVKPHGEEMTYDLEVEDDPHNFLANGFVVHNTGKSLGYLIPALLSGKRVVVSVTTKALQSQLANKDLPFLEEHLGVDFSWCVLKGRSNYLCVNRLALVTDRDVPDLPEITRLMQDPGFDGLNDTISTAIGHEVPYSSWSLICADSEECSDNNCSPSTCYAERARAAARASDLVIVNHALFFTDLVLKSYGNSNTAGGGGMLGAYDAVVFDEAHEMEEIAGNTLGGEVSEGAFNSALSQIRRWARDHADDEGESLGEPMSNVARTTGALFGLLEDGRLTDGRIAGVANELGALYEALVALRTALYETKIEHAPDHDKAYKRKRSLLRRINSIDQRMSDIVGAPQTEIVRWVETTRTRRGETRKVIKLAPILVAPFLYQHLFTKTPCVLVSATLAVKQSFSHICQRLGIPAPFEGLDVGTPFDYRTQGRLYVATRLPEPKGADQAAWQAGATAEISALIKASKGRALVLFTSVAHMRQTAQALAVTCTEFDIRQQYDAPTGELTEWLKDHNPERPRVLLATKSFFTGVDIPGEALSLVIISKMPFPVPTEPLTAARMEAIEAAGGSSFRDYTIPVMSLVLQQATGRLIRHRGDKGVVAILDPRLVSKSYGKQIIRDLPPMTPTYDLAEVEAFLN